MVVPPRSRHGKEFTINTNEYATMTRRIGNTTYLVKVYLSENATETFEEKVLRLVRNDRSLSMSEERKEHETEEN